MHEAAHPSPARRLKDHGEDAGKACGAGVRECRRFARRARYATLEFAMQRKIAFTTLRCRGRDYGQR
jgi:hypothetical protein